RGQAVIGGPLRQAFARFLGAVLRQAGVTLEAELAGCGSVREVGTDDVQPPTLRRFIRHHQPLTHQRPTVAGRQRRSKAGLVYMAEVQTPCVSPFSSVRRSASFSATTCGSCLCLRVRCVLLYETLARLSSRPRCCELNRTPWCSASQSANWPADQVRPPWESRDRTASSRWGVSWEGRPRCGWSERASNPSSRKRFTHCRTVLS